jgi:hypothetical protein
MEIEKETYELVFRAHAPKDLFKINAAALMEKHKEIGLKPLGCTNTQEILPDGTIKYTHRAYFEIGSLDPMHFYINTMVALSDQMQLVSFLITEGDCFKIKGKFEGVQA